MTQNISQQIQGQREKDRQEEKDRGIERENIIIDFGWKQRLPNRNRATEKQKTKLRRNGQK